MNAEIRSPAAYYAAGVVTFAEREALELRFGVPALSWAEIGVVLGISRASARDRVANALRKIAVFEERAA